MTVPVFANLGAGTSPDFNATTNIQFYSGSSWTPPSQGLILCFLTSSVSAGNPSIPSLAGNGLQWYQIRTALYGTSSSNRLTLFAANATGSFTGNLGANFSETQNCCRASLFMVSGSTVDFSQGVTGSIVQSASATINGGTTGTVSLVAASHTDNRPVFGVTHMANEAKAPKSGWSEFDDFGGTAPAETIETQVQRDAFDENPTAPWGTSALWAAIAAEIKGFQAGGGQTVDVSASLSRLESVSDSVSASLQSAISIAQKDGVSEGGNADVSANNALLAALGISANKGLALLSDLTLVERLGITPLGSVSIFPSLELGRDLAFVPANIALIGGSVSVGQALGLIDVPSLNIQASLAFLQSLGINLSSALATNQVEAVLSLAEHLGLTTSAQLMSFPLVGLENRLFLVDANNANMLGSNVLSEIRALNILGGISVQESLAIPIDFNLLTSKLVSVFGNVTVQERLEISESVIANLLAGVSLGEVTGMGNTVTQLLNAGLSISVIGSILTISGIDVIIVKG